jgi:hypothetical protein
MMKPIVQERNMISNNAATAYRLEELALRQHIHAELTDDRFEALIAVLRAWRAEKVDLPREEIGF